MLHTLPTFYIFYFNNFITYVTECYFNPTCTGKFHCTILIRKRCDDDDDDDDDDELSEH